MTNWTKLAEQAHRTSVERGNWKTETGYRNMAMQVVAELVRATEADHDGKHANRQTYKDECNVFSDSIAGYNERAKERARSYERNMLGSIEDCMAQACIILLDYVGHLKYTNMRLFSYAGRGMMELNMQLFCFGVCKELMDSSETSSGVTITYIMSIIVNYFTWRKVNLLYFIKERMAYNERKI